jgi:xylan 1,4-beta-xylosidase
MIQNPILPGFNPDPSICRCGDDYYIAVSSFEWFPGLPVYHSRDLKHWELYTHILTDDERVDLKKLPPSKGIWAPCLTYNGREQLFSVVYGVMNSMNARYFDCNNYLITAESVTGPWSSPVYLHSTGFDASLFTDDDGSRYIVSLEWETRAGYEKPGAICLAVYDPETKKITAYPKRIWRGGTDRGCIEAPHIYKRNGYYYLMCAEGGTGYNHCVTMGRAKDIRGPYERDPQNPIVTSSPGISNERHNPDHLKPVYYNPDSILQKSGHASWVETPAGESYLVHLCSRPFVPELCCTLGRETALQQMKWTKDGWLRMADGSNLAKQEVPEPNLPDSPVPLIPVCDDFDTGMLGLQYYAPRQMPFRFADVLSRPGYVRLRGEESLSSLNKVSLLARKLTSLQVQVTTELDFVPEVYQESAGLVLYYDNMNYVYLRKYYSETLGQSALSLVLLENGEKTEFTAARTPVRDVPLQLRLVLAGRELYFSWSYDGRKFSRIGRKFATAHFSDEYSHYGEFTGTMVGITCEDRVFHRKYADFNFFSYRESEDLPPDA